VRAAGRAGPGPAAAQGRTLALGDAGRYDLAPVLDVLEDPGASLELQDILRPEQQARFAPAPLTGPGTNFGITRSAIWLRVRVAAPRGADPHRLLELAYPPLDHVDFYTPLAGRWQRQASGDQLPFAQRAVAHRNHVVPVAVAPGPTATFYLRLESEGTLSAPLRLWRQTALWERDQASYAALSLYFGLLIGLLFYNLLLYVAVRDRVFAIYVAFVFGMALAQAALTGLGFQFAWPRWTWWNSVSVPCGLCIAAVFGLLFARNFLGSAHRMPVLDRGVLALAGGWLLALAAALLLPYVWSTYMISGLSVASVLLLVVGGVRAVRARYPGARQFLTAWALLLVGVFTLALHNMGLLPSNAFTANSLLLGSAAEMVLLSFALADRFNDSRRLGEQAQVRIAAEHAMVEALRESQQRLRRVLDEREIILQTSIVGIVFLTPEGRFKWANRAMLKIFGAEGRHIQSMEPFYLSREEYLRVGGDVARAVARGEVYENELQVQQADGRRIWISLSGQAVSREDLSQGTVWVIANITRRKELEEQLQATMREREAILNSALVGIVLSVARRHEWVNEKFAQMLGYPRQVLIGQSSVYIHPDEAAWQRFGEAARAALIETGSYICERQLRRRSGELLWVEMAGSCVRPHDPDSGVIWTFLDITQRKESESRMREALEQQRSLNALRSRFVAMTSHEFRTPLAAILSAEEVLRHYGDRLPEAERVETLDSIAAGVQRMSRMMDRVLLLGRAEAQMLEFEPGVVQLPLLCSRMVEEARLQHPGSSCQVECEVAPDVGEGVYDEKLLRHIFGNLLSNAIKYSPAGGKVVFGVRREGGDTVFEVSDAGIGIPAEELPHLFESFHRASNVGAIPGTGLGLAIVKNAVEVHGGTIAVESVLGGGTRFTVRLPQASSSRSGTSL
jgi:PAS domain S-box-containing protein